MQERAASDGRPDLVLRPWSESDAPALREAIDEDVSHVRPWMSWSLDEPSTVERTLEKLRDWVDQYRSGLVLRFAIQRLNQSDRILGGANLGRRAGPGARDLGYWVRASAARRGIAASAACALIERAFADDDTDRVVILCDVGNDRSVRLAGALGFTAIDPAVVAYPDGKPRPVLRFELTRERYDERECAHVRERAARVRILNGRAD